MKQALEHFDKSLSGLENLASTLDDPCDDTLLSTTTAPTLCSSSDTSAQLVQRVDKECKQSHEIILPVRYTFPSELQIREILIRWVANKPLYRKNVAKQMVFTVVNSVIVYLYRLETFSEKRTVCNQREPYADCVLDAPMKGWQMGLWDIPTAPSQMFTNEAKFVRVPHTDQVKTCPECHGTKCIPCCECRSTGCVRCLACWGSGTTRLGLPCLVCRGRQLVLCMKCMGEGKLYCTCCNGSGVTCHFKALKAEFKSTVHEHISTQVEVPRHLVATAKGEILLDHDDRTVNPITTCSERDINRVSRSFVKISRSISGPDCRILRQRHHIKAVPVTSVYFRWKSESGHFFVYGLEEAIYCTQYPQKTRSCACC